MKLLDYEKWKKINTGHSFNIVDYIDGSLKSHNINPDVFLAVLNLAWPEFVLIEGMIFIRDFYLNQKKNVESNTYKNKAEAECWVNFLSLAGFLDIEDEEKQAYLVKILGESWKSKLAQDFPSGEFEIIIIDDAEDLGLSFRQTSYKI